MLSKSSFPRLIFAGALALLITSLFVFLIKPLSLSDGYSSNPSYRYQTEAFFNGQLTVTQNPAELRHDWLWNNSGAQQPWGLGVPLLRTPFELLAKAFGYNSFPDRFVLVFYYFLAVMMFFILLTMNNENRLNKFVKAGITAFFFLSPVLLSMLMSRFDVYEEAIFYLAISNILIIGLLYRLSNNYTTKLFLITCFLAGFIVLIRPTGVFYSMVSFLLLAFIGLRNKLKVKQLSVGFIFYILAPLFLALTNYLRFGSPINFGSFDALSAMTSLTYAGKFGADFINTPFSGAALELLGTAFSQNNPGVVEHAFPYYNANLYSWQLQNFRMREYYSPGFPIFSIILLLIAWISPIVDRIRSTKKNNKLKAVPIIELLTAWSFLSTVLLFLFYLWTYAISSRYIVDFVPAITLGCSLGLFHVWRAIGPRLNRGPAYPPAGALIASLIIVGWSAYYLTNYHQNFHSHRNIYNYAQPIDAVSTAALMQNKPLTGNLPSDYECNRIKSKHGINANYNGWNETITANSSLHCAVDQTTTIFHPPMHCVTLIVHEVVLGEGSNGIKEFNPDFVKIEAQGEKLKKIEHVKLSNNHHRYKFCRSNVELQQARWGYITIGWVSAETLSSEIPAAQLLRVTFDNKVPKRQAL